MARTNDRRVCTTAKVRDASGEWVGVHGVTVVLLHPRGPEWGGPYFHHSSEASVDLEIRSGGALLGTVGA